MVEMNSRIELLQRSPLLVGLPEPDRRMLLSSSIEKRFAAQETIAAEGVAPNALYFVLSGGALEILGGADVKKFRTGEKEERSAAPARPTALSLHVDSISVGICGLQAITLVRWGYSRRSMGERRQTGAPRRLTAAPIWLPAVCAATRKSIAVSSLKSVHWAGLHSSRRSQTPAASRYNG